MEQAQSRPRQSKQLGTVLVVGGCGFLGYHVVDQLLNFPSDEQHSNYSPSTKLTTISLGPNSGRYAYKFPTKKSRYSSHDPSNTKVHALDLRCVRNQLPGCTYHEADITNAEQLVQVFRRVRPDVVINTATASYMQSYPILKKVNIEGTKTLVEVAAGRHGDWGGRCRAFVHTSSSSVIHDTISELKNADERWPLVVPNPRERYSETKAYAERVVLDANGMDGLLTAAVRPAGIIGEYDTAGISHGPLATAAEKGLGTLHVQLGEGDNLFDITYVGNVALALLMVAEGLLETSKRKAEARTEPLDHERIDGEAFIVTNDSPNYFWSTTQYMYTRYGKDIRNEKLWVLPEGLGTVIGAFSEIVGAVTGRKGRITRQTIRYSCMDRYYSCEKLKRRTGYLPVINVEEGLARAVDAFIRTEADSRASKSVQKKVQ